MKRQTILLLIGGTLLLLLLPGLVTGAQGGYDLSWHTADGGGAMFSTGGGYSLGGTVGQSDAGLLAGGTYTLGGGFWKGGALRRIGFSVYLPLITR